MSNIKKHLKKERLLSPLLLAAIRIWKQQPGLSGPLQRMVQISSNLAYRSLILPQKVPSFRGKFKSIKGRNHYG